MVSAGNGDDTGGSAAGIGAAKQAVGAAGGRHPGPGDRLVAARPGFRTVKELVTVTTPPTGMSPVQVTVVPVTLRAPDVAAWSPSGVASSRMLALESEIDSPVYGDLTGIGVGGQSGHGTTWGDRRVIIVLRDDQAGNGNAVAAPDVGTCCQAVVCSPGVPWISECRPGAGYRRRRRDGW